MRIPGANAQVGEGRCSPRLSSAAASRESVPGGEACGSKVEDGSLTQQPLPAALSDDAETLLDILSAASKAKPVTQERAGKLLGFTGGRETIRRRVQHLRDEIIEANGRVICANWGSPPGMYLPESEHDEDEYIGRVLSRAYTTIGQFRWLERTRRLRIAEEVQGILGLGGEVDRQPLRVVDRSCPMCGGPVEGKRTDSIYCSADCRYQAARKRGSV